jgi:hypothetical protein
MRYWVTAGCLLAAVIVFALPVAAAERQMQQNYSVSIRVDCLETAIEVLRGLPGNDLNSGITYFEPHTGRPVRQAHFSRRVDNHFFRHVQNALREMGEVLYESENTRHLGAELMQLETRISVLTEEINRLSVMMAASTTLNVLTAIDNQLSRVSRERDDLTGRRNRLQTEANTTFIHISLTEEAEYIRPAPLTFGRRVTDRFLNSWDSLLRGLGNFAVFMVRVSLPLVIWVVVGGVALLLGIRLVKRKIKKSKLEAPEVPQEGAIINEEQ